jgi:hypothetical protein
MEPLERLLNTIDGGDGGVAEQVLLELVDGHRPSVFTGAVHRERSVAPNPHCTIEAGDCAWCRYGYALIREYRGQLNGHGRKVLLHDHVDPTPSCTGGCAQAASYDWEPEDWPCAFLLKVAKHYNVDLEAS